MIFHAKLTSILTIRSTALLELKEKVTTVNIKSLIRSSSKILTVGILLTYVGLSTAIYFQISVQEFMYTDIPRLMMGLHPSKLIVN